MKSTRCEAGKRGDHKDCDGTMPRGFDEKHDWECTCDCRDTRVEREHFSDHRTGTTKKK
jgi:hypothetical protein